MRYHCLNLWTSLVAICNKCAEDSLHSCAICVVSNVLKSCPWCISFNSLESYHFIKLYIDWKIPIEWQHMSDLVLTPNLYNKHNIYLIYIVHWQFSYKVTISNFFHPHIMITPSTISPHHTHQIIINFTI